MEAELLRDDDAACAVASVPVTIVTGFLGSGKTTLLRHVLASPHGLRIAVLQNELSAAAGLEATTMIGPDGERFERWLELANGCVCCEVRDELAKGIETLFAVKGAFDYGAQQLFSDSRPEPSQNARARLGAERRRAQLAATAARPSRHAGALTHGSLPGGRVRSPH